MNSGEGNSMDGQQRSLPNEWPEEFVCPITGLPMADPVVLSSGHSAERIGMDVWLNLWNNLQCPVTGARLESKALISNINLQKAICNEVSAHGIMQPTPPSIKYATMAVTEFDIDFTNHSMVLERIRKLKSAYQWQRDETIQKIHCDTRDLSRELRLALCKSGLLTSLFEAVQSSTDRGSASAHVAVVILNMSLELDNKVKIVRFQAVLPWLIETLSRGATKAKENAVAAIFSLAMIVENRYEIGKLGGIPPLLNLLLDSQNLQAQKDCANALYHLSSMQANLIHLKKHNAVPELIKLLRMSSISEELKICILPVLNILASTSEDGRKKLLESDGIIHILTQLLCGSNQAEIREHCVAILLLLSKHNTRFAYYAFNDRAWEVLKDMQNYGSYRAKRKATDLLKALNNYNNNNWEP